MIKELIIKYSRMERTTSVDEVQHPIIRESLKLVGIADPTLRHAMHEAGLREVRFRFDFEGTKVVAQA